jgi:NADH:ubiquinone oxidoreductase subunit 3 (subunit A)
MLLCGNNALKQKTVHSSMAYYIQVILYNVSETDVYLLKIRNFRN